MAKTVNTLEMLAILNAVSPVTLVGPPSPYSPRSGAVRNDCHKVSFADVTSMAWDVIEVFQLAVVCVTAFLMTESRPENNCTRSGDPGFRRGAGNGSLGSKQPERTSAEKEANTTRPSIGKEKEVMMAVVTNALFDDII